MALSVWSGLVAAGDRFRRVQHRTTAKGHYAVARRLAVDLISDAERPSPHSMRQYAGIFHPLRIQGVECLKAKRRL